MSQPIFRPWPGPQTQFLQWDGYYALFGGAAAAGKTDCLLYDPFRQIKSEEERIQRGEIKRSVGRAGFFRRTMPEIREALDRAKRTFPLIDPGVEWKEQEKTFTFSCGYKYMFCQMEEPGDWIKYYGFEFTWLGFDELCTFTEEQFDQLDTRLRSGDPVLHAMRCIRAGTNPVGIGLEWVRKRFVEVAPPGVPAELHIRVPILKNGKTEIVIERRRQIFIPGKVSDNPSIDQASYTATLMTKPSAVKRALLDGDWYVSAGAFLADLWDPQVHVCEPFKIPKSWPKYRSCDYGYMAPASVSWWAVDPDGNLVCFRNLTVTKHNAEMLGYRIKEIEIELDLWDMQRGCSKITGPLDFESFGQRGHVGPTIAETMNLVGVHWFRCDKDRKSAADQMRWRLSRRTGHPTIKDENEKAALLVPGIRWFKTCRDPIKTIPVLPADKNDPEVPDTNANDHNYDDASYMCLARPMSGKSDMEDAYDSDELEQARRKKVASGKRTSYGLW